MSRAIFKYEIPIQKTSSVWMSGGAEILSIQNQSGKIMAWAEVTREAPQVLRYFQVYGTGQEIIRSGTEATIWRATVQIHGFVWHVYETIPGPRFEDTPFTEEDQP